MAGGGEDSPVDSRKRIQDCGRESSVRENIARPSESAFKRTSNAKVVSDIVAPERKGSGGNTEAWQPHASLKTRRGRQTAR
jgi:hypothetical protein